MVPERLGTRVVAGPGRSARQRFVIGKTAKTTAAPESKKAEDTEEASDNKDNEAESITEKK